MSDPENPNPYEPVPPAQEPVPPAQQPVPPAAEPVPPAAEPVPPAAEPVPSAKEPVPPAQAEDDNQVLPAIPIPATSRPALKRPATGRSPSGYPPTPYKQKDSSPLHTIIIGIIAVFLLIAAVVLLIPRSLEHIDGYPYNTHLNQEPDNLLLSIQDAFTKNAVDLNFSEKQINDYLNYRIQAADNSGGFMKVRGIYIDFRNDEAEINIVRSIPLLGKNTVSTTLLSKYNEQLKRGNWKTEGFSVGKFSWGSGTIDPIYRLCKQLSELMNDEVKAINQMNRVKFLDNQLSLQSQPQRN